MTTTRPKFLLLGFILEYAWYVRNKKENSTYKKKKHLPSPTMPRTSNLFITSPRVRAPPAGKKEAALDLERRLPHGAVADGLNHEVQEKGRKCLIAFHLQPCSTSLSHLVASLPWMSLLVPTHSLVPFALTGSVVSSVHVLHSCTWRKST